MTTYRELIMITNAGNELRTKIRNGLSLQPDTSGGEINCIDIDPDTGDLIVTAQYTGGQRVMRIILKDEGPGPYVAVSQEEIEQRLAEAEQTVSELDTQEK